MKNHVNIITLVLLLCCQNSIAQTPSPMQYLQQQSVQPNNTPEAYFHLADSIMQLEYGTDSSEGGPMNTYQRFKHFMESRCAPVFDSINITDPYLDALINAKALSGNGCGSGQPVGTWENIGPRTDDPNVQNQGWVTAIYEDPGNSSHVIIGTRGAGVWQTPDDGQNWYNITDNTTPLGTFGVQAMAVNPNDPEDIYIAAQMFVKAPIAGNHIGMGIWHTTDGGLTPWVLEALPTSPCLANPAKAIGNDVEFCPYQVAGQDYVVVTVTDGCEIERVYAKLGIGPWIELTTPALTGVNGWNCRHFTDIEFMDDNPGKILIASKWPLGWADNQGVYTVHFNATTGGSLPPYVTPFVDRFLNGNTNLFCGDQTGTALSFSVEYMGNGLIYMSYNWGFGSCSGTGNYRTNIAELNYSTPNTISNLVANMQTQFLFHECELEATPNSNVMYMILTQPVIIYNTNNTWKWNTLAEYLGDPQFHGDLRTLHIGFTGPTNQNLPGNADRVYWGNDGGISRTTGHNISVYSGTPNSAAYTAGCRITQNLNGNNLYLGNLWEADKEPFGQAYVAGGWDNGIHYFNQAANLWTSGQVGDGINGNFDKRFSDGTNFTFIEHMWTEVRRVTNPGSSYTIGVGVGQPEAMSGMWRPHPISFRKGFMYMGQRRPWESNHETSPNPYFVGQLSPQFNFQQSPNYSSTGELKKRWYNDGLFCKQFMISPSNDNVAYHLFFGTKKKAIFNRGNMTGLAWNWVTSFQNLPGGDQTPTQIEFDGYPGTDFCIDDKNPDRIFLALGGIKPGFPATDRVLFSSDGGNSWNSMSTGLTELPVNCLVYQNGTNDLIYAGTDDGVYYWDAALGCWIKMNGSKIPGQTIPNIMVTKLRIDYCSGKLIAATFGRGIWESDILYPTTYPGPTETIQPATTVTWGDNLGTITNKLIEGSILIKSGATLNIVGLPNTSANTATTSTTNIYMPKRGQILIEKGGKLIVNGAKITNGCGVTWDGIYTYGHGAVPQTINPNTGHDDNHGWVLLDHAIIENAQEALNNGGGNNYPWSNTGGIIQVSKTHFINNHRSAAFYKYRNFMGTVLNADMSFIVGSRFDVDDNTHSSFYTHITNWGTSGIRIEQNSFNNDQNTTIDHQNALLSIDAGYKFRYNTVTGFKNGIDASIFSYSYENVFPINIAANIFDKNQISLHLKNLTLPIVVWNDFKIGMRQDGGSGPYYSLGTKMESSSSFAYLYNTHKNDYGDPSTVYTAGTEVHNTGQNDELISRNTYEGLWIGNDGDYTCANITNDLFGLKYTCNENVDNLFYDFIFQANPYIRKFQDGSTIDFGAGNTFTQSGTIASWHQTVGGNGPVNYQYNTNSIVEIPNGNSFNYTPIAKNSSDCNSAFNYNIPELDSCKHDEIETQDLTNLKNQFWSADSSYQLYHTLHLQLLDNGNTEELVEEIQNVSINEQLATRAYFLSISPYVSQTALKELGLQAKVSSPIFLEILLANPSATHSESFIDIMRNEIPYPLPEYMIDMVRASWSGPSTPRDILEQNMSYSHNQMTILKNHIIRTYIVNPSLANLDSAYVWKEKVPSIRNSYEIIEHNLFKSNFAISDSLVANIKSNFRFSSRDDVEHDVFLELYNFKKAMINDSIEINALDSTRVMNLKQIADYEDYSFARSMARNALCFFYNICYPDSQRSLPLLKPNLPANGNAKGTSAEVLVYPNPAKDFVVFHYDLGVNQNMAKELILTDLTGKLIYHTPIQGQKGQFIWDCRNFSTGTYLYVLKTIFGNKFSGKVVVQR